MLLEAMPPEAVASKVGMVRAVDGGLSGLEMRLTSERSKIASAAVML